MSTLNCLSATSLPHLWELTLSSISLASFAVVASTVARTLMHLKAVELFVEGKGAMIISGGLRWSGNGSRIDLNEKALVTCIGKMKGLERFGTSGLFVSEKVRGFS